MNSSFFEPEVRSGYLVSREMKKLWAVQLDLLRQLDALCKKHGLRYFAQGGTLLGAARHRGFIPWDDDVDVVMLWEDYRKLLEIAKEDLSYPYFLQNYLSEAEAEPTFARLRRSDTTGCTRFELECISADYNKGIFIDIFPLFYVPEDETERLRQKDEIGHWWRLYKGYEVHREKQRNGFSKLAADYEPYEQLYLAQDPQMIFQEIKQRYVEACLRQKERTGRVAPLSFRVSDPKTTWPSEWFDESVELPFEELQIPCPKHYEDMLQHQFGDWRTPVMKGAMHEMGVYDAQVPYTEKLGRCYVREYFSSDFEDLSALLHEVYGSTITKEELEEHYLGPDRFILIAVVDQKLAGCAFLSLTTDYVRASRSSFVTYVAVDSKYRRMGIATRIFEEIERLSRAYDSLTVELTSADFRTDAHAFYYARNFTRKKTTVFIKELAE